MKRCFLPEELPRLGGCWSFGGSSIARKAVYQLGLALGNASQIRAMAVSLVSSRFSDFSDMLRGLFLQGEVLGLGGSRFCTLKAKYDKAFRGPPLQSTPNPLRD
jgi:hypothetical protein